MKSHQLQQTLISVAVLLVAGIAPAHAQLFNFESETPTYVAPPAEDRPGALTSLSITNGGVTMTVTRQNGTAFDIVSNTGAQSNKPEGWGNNSLDPFFATGNDGWILNFSKPLTSFSIEYGDYSIPDIDSIQLQAFTALGGSGILTGTGSDAQSVFFPLAQTVSVSSDTPFQSILITSTSSTGAHNSTYLDNVNVVVASSAAAPEPGTFALLGVGMGMVGFITRRRAM